MTIDDSTASPSLAAGSPQADAHLAALAHIGELEERLLGLRDHAVACEADAARQRVQVHRLRVELEGMSADYALLLQQVGQLQHAASEAAELAAALRVARIQIASMGDSETWRVGTAFVRPLAIAFRRRADR